MGDEKLLENDVVSGSAENLDTVLMGYMDDDMTDENADPFNPVIDENDPKYIEAMQFAENYQPSDDDYPAEGYFEDDYFDGFSDNEVSSEEQPVQMDEFFWENPDGISDNDPSVVYRYVGLDEFKDIAAGKQENIWEKNGYVQADNPEFCVKYQVDYNSDDTVNQVTPIEFSTVFGSVKDEPVKLSGPFEKMDAAGLFLEQCDSKGIESVHDIDDLQMFIYTDAIPDVYTVNPADFGVEEDPDSVAEREALAGGKEAWWWNEVPEVPLTKPLSHEDATVTDRIDRLCDRLENYKLFDESNKDWPIDPHWWRINNDTLNRNIIPDVKALREIFDNIQGSLSCFSGIILGEKPTQDMDTEKHSALINDISVSLGENGIVPDILKAFDSCIEKLEQYTEKKPYDAETMRSDVLGSVKELLVDVQNASEIVTPNLEKFATECSGILNEHLEQVPQELKEKIAAVGHGIFSYGENADGSVDKSSINADSGFSLKSNGSFTNEIGLSLDGQFRSKIDGFSDPYKIANGKDTIYQLPVAINEYFRGKDPNYKIVDEGNRVHVNVVYVLSNYISDFKDLESFDDKEAFQAVEKYCEALEKVYAVNIPDPDKIENVIDKVENSYITEKIDSDQAGTEKASMDRNEERIVIDDKHDSVGVSEISPENNAGADSTAQDNQKFSADSGFTKSEHDFGTVESPERFDFSSGDGKAKEMSSYGLFPERKFLMSHWERLDNPDNDPVVDKINSWIDKRNAASERSGLFRAEEWSDKFAFSTWRAVTLARRYRIEINGHVPNARDKLAASQKFWSLNVFDGFINFHIINDLYDIAHHGVRDWETPVTNDKSGSVDRNISPEQMAADKDRLNKESAIDGVSRSISRMAEGIELALSKEEPDRSSADKKSLTSISGSYRYSVCNVLTLYKNENGPDVVKETVLAAIDSLKENPKVSTETIVRLSNLVEKFNSFKIGDEKVTVEFNQDSQDKTDTDGKNVENGDPSEKSDTEGKTDLESNRESGKPSGPMAVGSSIIDMAFKIDEILSKEDRQRLSEEKNELSNISKEYKSAVSSMIKMNGIELTKAIITASLEPIKNSDEISNEAAARLENLIENENTFEVDGNEVTIDFKEESDRADRDEEAQENVNNIETENDTADSESGTDYEDGDKTASEENSAEKEISDVDSESTTEDEEPISSEENGSIEHDDDRLSDEKDDEQKEKLETNSDEKADTSNSDPSTDKPEKKESVDEKPTLPLAKEEQALKDKLEGKLSGKVTVNNIANDPDIRKCISDIRKVAGGQNISDSVARVAASISSAGEVDEDKLKSACKGMEKITKVDGDAVKIKGIIGKMGEIIKELANPTLGVVAPETLMLMDMTDKFKGYLDSKISLPAVVMNVKAYIDNAGDKLSDIKAAVSDAMTNAVEYVHDKIADGIESVLGKIQNLVSSISAATGIDIQVPDIEKAFIQDVSLEKTSDIENPNNDSSIENTDGGDPERIEANEENSLGSGEDFAPENDFEERNMNYEEAGNSQLFQAETVDLNDMSESSQEINPLNEDLASIENEDSPTAGSGNQDANSILEKTGGEKDKQDDVESVLAVNADSESSLLLDEKDELDGENAEDRVDGGNVTEFDGGTSIETDGNSPVDTGMNETETDIEVEDMPVTENSNDNEPGVEEAISAYMEDPMFDFGDFLDSPISIDGDEMSISEAIDNDAISSSEIADAVSNAIADNADDILSDDSVREGYSDLMSDLADYIGDEFIGRMDESMDPYASVSEVAEAAFNDVFDGMLENVDISPSVDFGVFDLADLESSIVSSIDADNIIQDGVEAALAGIDNSYIDTGIENVNSDMDSGMDLLDSVSDQPLLNDFSTDSSTMDSPNPADFPQEDNFEPAVVETDTPSDTAVDFGTDKMDPLLDTGSDFASDQLQQTYDWDGVD